MLGGKEASGSVSEGTWGANVMETKREKRDEKTNRLNRSSADGALVLLSFDRDGLSACRLEGHRGARGRLEREL